MDRSSRQKNKRRLISSVIRLAIMLLPLIVLCYVMLVLVGFPDLDITSGLLLAGIGLMTIYVNLKLNRQISSIATTMMLNIILSVAGIILFYVICIVLIMFQMILQGRIG